MTPLESSMNLRTSIAYAPLRKFLNAFFLRPEIPLNTDKSLCFFYLILCQVLDVGFFPASLGYKEELRWFMVDSP